MDGLDLAHSSVFYFRDLLCDSYGNLGKVQSGRCTQARVSWLGYHPR